MPTHECHIVDCVNHKDCAILEITKKTPKNADSCSYFKTQKQADKTNKKLEKFLNRRK